MSRRPIGSCWLAPALLATLPVTTAVADDDWRTVPIPDTWKEPPRVRPADDSGSGRDGYAWYRAAVDVPADWRGRPIALFVEPVDDARAAYVNGRLVGASGSFPPQYRSGLGDPGRFTLPDGLVRPGERNVVAVRVYYNDGRSNFAVAPPALYVADGAAAIRLEGPWEYRAGDDPAWALGPVESARAHYAEVDRVDDLDAYLRRRRDDTAPVPPEEAVKRFTVADDLALDLVLSEPEIAQPLQMSFDERGRLWLVEYRQYPEPAGLAPVSRDKYLRTVYDSVPAPPPHGTPGRDRITIHEDTDRDGTYDRHTTFVDGLNMATAAAVGDGGVWVLNPPYLLFYPDLDGDDVPDGDPVVHLEGFGLEDSHSLCNSLTWGPDGWLYGAQGSTVTGHVRRPGEPDDAMVHSMGQLIWRYHPGTHRYEVFAEGGGNTFGLEIDAKGRIYSGHNGGDTRGFHYVQGGYYLKGFTKHGALSNPYAFGYFPSMAHHSVPRFSHAFLIYEGTGLPADYKGQLFGVEPLQGQVVLSEVTPDGSTFATRDLTRPVATEDPWFRPVAIALGPLGELYVADFYEQRIDHSSHYAGRIDRTNGRVYRIRGRGTSAGGALPDFRSMPGEALLDQLDDPNRWTRRTALRLIAERADTPEAEGLIRKVRSSLDEEKAGQQALESLWALNLLGGLDEAAADRLLDHPDPHVRAWTVRLVCDDFEIGRDLAEALVALAEGEPYVIVRSQLASSARRLPADQALPIVRALLRHDEDANDPHLPLLLWWAIEAEAGEDPDRVLALFDEAGLWDRPIVVETIVDRLMRRFARSGTRADLIACAALLEKAPSREVAARLLASFEEAMAGRSLGVMPDRLVAAIAAAGGGSLALRVRQGDAESVADALATVADPSADAERRAELIRTLGEVRADGAVPALLGVAGSEAPDSLRASALAALRPFDDPEIADRVIGLLPELPEEARAAALDLLAGRRSWASALLDAIADGRVDRSLVPESVARSILLFDDSELAARVERSWGALEGATTVEMRERIERYEGVIAGAAGNPYVGKDLFLQHCGRCHTLFDDGGDVGPNLTSYQRDDLDAMLLAVVNPGAEVREGFETYLALMEDGRVATGFLVERDDRTVVLRGADGRNQLLPADEIEAMRQVPQSVMPLGLLEPLDDRQVRDLFAYLRSTQPLNN